MYWYLEIAIYLTYDYNISINQSHKYIDHIHGYEPVEKKTETKKTTESGKKNEWDERKKNRTKQEIKQLSHIEHDIFSLLILCAILSNFLDTDK